MGLWPWLTSQLFTPKFWKSIKTDGLLLTYTRGHKAIMSTHTVGGNSQRTKLVGRDQYGNKYYEDFDALYYSQRRWVEYNCYTTSKCYNGNMIPPKWHGWLAQQYDDVPLPDSDSFHDPYFQKSNENDETCRSARLMYISRQSANHDKAVEFQKQRMNLYASQWQPGTKRQL